MEPITASLLAWYDRCARTLPWRGIHDAYRTWVSEAMLQQTRVETVLSYYERFLARFPDLPALAAASEDEVLKEWEGLGYYSRARNLWRGAKQVMTEYGGSLPADPDSLREISGIGPYTAGAIASIAFDVPVPAVDGNVIRVITRLYGIPDNVQDTPVRRRIEELAAALVPPERPGDHNQAVMDLGATVCVPGTPDCARCPLTAYCAAYRDGSAAELPLLPRAKPQRVIPYALLLLRSDGRVLIGQRSERLLQGLWCFPMIEGEFTEEELVPQIRRKFGLACPKPQKAGSARHVFTHRIWEMTLYTADAGASAPAPKGYAFVSPDQLDQLAMPAAMSAAVAVLTREA